MAGPCGDSGHPKLLVWYLFATLLIAGLGKINLQASIKCTENLILALMVDFLLNFCLKKFIISHFADVVGRGIVVNGRVTHITIGERQT